jgi:bacterioferritin
MKNEHIKNGYSYPAPYPEIKVMEKNKEYAEILMNDYSGIVSEMTAINQYLYHHYVINEEDVMEILEKISINEMLHLEILAELIKKLGGNPVYRDSNNTYWNGTYVYYGNNICDQIKMDLKSEYDAINNYKKDLEVIKDPYIQEIIKRIILDEEIHTKLFLSILNKYCINQ